MKNRIRLDTMSDVNEFVAIAMSCKGKVLLQSSDGFCVSGKSMLGALASMEFNDLWVVSDEDIYSRIEKFIIIEDIKN